ncbi:MAG: hypothetical protein ACLTZB_01360 [Streptococcus salivarius]
MRGKQVLLADEMMASLDAASSKEIRNVLQQLPNSIIEIAHHYNLKITMQFIELKISQS